MYFDAVLDVNMRPLFNDTPEEVAKWLRGQEWINSPGVKAKMRVIVGETLKELSVDEYLEKGGK